jgi:hypothetical protein
VTYCVRRVRADLDWSIVRHLANRKGGLTPAEAASIQTDEFCPWSTCCVVGSSIFCHERQRPQEVPEGCGVQLKSRLNSDKQMANESSPYLA